MEKSKSEEKKAENVYNSTDFTPIQYAINSILKISLNNDIKDKFDSFSDLNFLPNGSLENYKRRPLESIIEKRSLEMNQNFLSVVRMFRKSLDDVHENATIVQKCIRNITANIQSVKTESSKLYENTSALQSEYSKVTLYETICEAFVQNFQLSAAELNVLKKPESSLPSFFAALDKINLISTNCYALIKNGHQNAAISINGQLAIILESTLEVLHKWVLSHFENTESGPNFLYFPKALKILQDKPFYFNNILDAYSGWRGRTMLHDYIKILTAGGKGSDTKPDVSELLEFIFRYIPPEKERAENFLKGCRDSGEIVNKILSRIIETIHDSLRSRIEYTITSANSPFELYNTMNALTFYANCYSKDIYYVNLFATLETECDMCLNAFLNLLQNNVKLALLEHNETPPFNLVPSMGMTRVLTFMKEILSMVSLTQQCLHDIEKVISCMVDPLLQAVTLSASKLNTTEMSIYQLNCLNEITLALPPYDFVKNWMERLKGQVEAQLDTLTSQQASSLVVNLNLGPIYTILQDKSESLPLSEIAGMDDSNLESFAKNLETLLINPHGMMLPQMNYLKNSSHWNVIYCRSMEVIIAVYKRLYNSINDATNKYKNTATILPHTPEEIRQALITKQCSSFKL